VPRAQPDALELEPGEEILATAHASFRGAAAASTRATFAFGAGRMRDREFRAWRVAAESAGFPVVADDMLLAITDRRLLMGKFRMPGRARVYTAELTLDRIRQVVAVRHGLVVGAAFVLVGGAIVELEAMRGRALAHLVGVIDELLSG